jgi:hypothetical protein
VSLTDQAKEVARRAAGGSLNDVPAAAEQALNEIKAMPGYAAMAEALVRQAVRDLVYAARHEMNRSIKHASGDYARRSTRKVQAYSPAVAEAHRSVYDLCIGGTTLGNLVGREVVGLLSKTRSMIAGHRLNEELLGWLSTRVPPDKTVRESVKETELSKFYYEARDRLAS